MKQWITDKFFSGKRADEAPSRVRKFLLLGFSLFLGCVLLGFIGAAILYFRFADELPDIRQFVSYQPSTATQVYADNDELIADFYIEKRIMLPLDEIPLRLRQATLAVEDSNFYYHFGIDPKAIFRAMLTNLKAGHVVEGGSTITQQLSKRIFLTPERTLNRKIKEAILAIRMEVLFSKNEILEMYLNQIYYGHGSYGVEAAAQTYFNKHVKELTLEECAMLAALPKAPNGYSPFKNPEKALNRRNHAIRRMAQMDFIDEMEKEAALASELTVGELPDGSNPAPHFVEHIRRQLLDTYGSNKLYRSGLKIYTTLNLEHQAQAIRAVRENLRVADKRYGFRKPRKKVDLNQDPDAWRAILRKKNQWQEESERPAEGDLLYGAVTDLDLDRAMVDLGGERGVIELANMDWARPPNIKVDGRWERIRRPSKALNRGDVIQVRVLAASPEGGPWSLALEQEPEVEAGLISIEPQTGHIKAMVGGYDYNRSQFNRAVQAIRQPGSAFKPVIYVAALAAGYTPASIIVDSPIIFKEKEEAFDQWKPVNFEEKFYGPTSLRTALTHSRNIVTVKLLQNIGIRPAVQVARDLGITTPLSENLSMALGSSGVSLLEITGAYSVFAKGGERIPPTAIRAIENRHGETLFTHEPQVSRPISSGIASTITSLLESVVQEGTGEPVKVLGRPVAGKTGTTNDYVDAWFIGYTPQLVTGVWVGRDDHAPLGINETGSRAAIPIWLQYMQEAMEGQPILNFPASNEVVYLKVSPETGEPAGFLDPESQFEITLAPPPAELLETGGAEEPEPAPRL
jgi:penicillin-binding protein 1A